MTSKIRTYHELIQLPDHLERFNYLTLQGVVGRATFGTERYLNQRFYHSREWRQLRDEVITRDLGRDLGAHGHEIYDSVYIHHMNPMTVADIVNSDEMILNPEYVISVSHATHNAIHYGNASLLRQPYVERRRGDTNLW